MRKRKGAAVVLGIMLFAASGWAALVTYVLTDNFWVGAALSVVGGAAIGTALFFLLIMPWFRRARKEP